MVRASMLWAVVSLGAVASAAAQAPAATPAAPILPRAGELVRAADVRAIDVHAAEVRATDLRAEYRRRLAALPACRDVGVDVDVGVGVGAAATASSAITATAAEDVAARLELARWCELHGLRAQMRQHAAAVLQRDPQHAVAHDLLGHQHVGGKWLPHDAAMRARGLVLHGGKWMRKYDVVVQQHREQQARERARLERELSAHFGRLAAASAASRAGALQKIEALAHRRGWPELADLARDQKSIYDAYWRQQLVTATVRLQKSEVLSMTPFTTSLGVGIPVTLQLPRVRTISISTTVVLPAGSGR